MQNKYLNKEGDIYYLIEEVNDGQCDSCLLCNEDIDLCNSIRLVDVKEELEFGDCPLPIGFIIDKIEIKKYNKKKLIFNK